MQPRYRPGQGDPTTDATRARALAAARAHLLEMNDAAQFAIDVVAAKAGIARSVLQRQFHSRAGLLEALYDDLILRSKLTQLPESFQHQDSRLLVSAFFASVTDAWDTERNAMRRLRALAAFDPELARAVCARDEYRRETLRALLRRLTERGLSPRPSERDALETLHALTSFELLDQLAGSEREIASVLPQVERLAWCAFEPAAP